MPKISSKREEEHKYRARRMSIKEGAAYSVTDGAGLRFITPFALALGANAAQIGFLNSAPHMFGNLFQMLTLRLMKRSPRKTIVVFGALMQGLMWLPLIAIAALRLFADISTQSLVYLLIAFYTVLVIFGGMISPAWNSWMKDVITRHVGRYFGRRSRINGFVIIATMLAAGALLDFFRKTEVFYGFVILFLLAFLARMYSVSLFRRQYEPKFTPDDRYFFTLRQFVEHMFSNNFGRFVIFVSLLSFATAIAAPFFAVYMLKDLGFSYLTFTIVSMTASFTTILFVSFWGRFADKYGNIKVMRMTGFFIPFIPLLWLFFGSTMRESATILMVFLVLVEVMSGIVWSGLNLSAVNFIYDAVSRERLAICVAYFNILTSIGAFFGAMIGGFIASSGIFAFGLKPILLIFLLSGVLRAAVYFLMMPRLQEVRPVKKFGLKEAERKLRHMKPETIIKILR